MLVSLVSAWETTFIILAASTAALTIVCAARERHSIFGTMVFLGMAYFAAMAFAVESKNKPVMAVVGVGGLLPFAWICWSGVRRFVQRSDAWGWRLAGMTGGVRLWQKYQFSGRPAREHWLMQIICSALILITLACGLAVHLPRIEPDAAKSAPRRATIIDASLVMSSLNESTASWVSWPSPEIKEQAGEGAWGNWKPKNGDEGEIVGTMTSPGGGTIYVLKIAGGGKDYYVAVRSGGIDILKR